MPIDLTTLSRAFTKAFDLGRTLSTSERSTVVEAVRTATRQCVVVKLVEPGDESVAQAVERLRAAAAVRHPNVVAIVEVGDAGPAAYVALEALEGSLADRLRTASSSGALPVATAVDVALDCAKGLAAARRKGLTARALTPDHVLLAAGGQAKVLGLVAVERAEAEDARAVARLMEAMLESAGGLGVLPVALRAVMERAASGACDLESLTEALRPHASRTGAVVQPPPEPERAALPEAERLPAGPLILVANGPGGGRRAGVTQVINLPREARSAFEPGARRRTAALVVLTGVLAIAFGAGALGVRWGFWRTAPAVLDQGRAVYTTRVGLTFKTQVECFAKVEYWEAMRPANKLRTPAEPGDGLAHRALLANLKPDTAYAFRYLLSYGREDEDGDCYGSGVFGATTRPEVQIFNIHVDEYATKAVATWETNLRTDTAVKYGRTENYEDLRVNGEQASETIHSITLESLKPEQTYHYQIVATDPRGRGESRASEDLQFRTAREDAADQGERDSAGMVRLTRVYVDKLTRMTPDEREKLKSSINTYAGPDAPLTRADKAALLATKTSAARDDEFHDRLSRLRRWYGDLQAQGRRVGDPAKVCRLLQSLFYVNRVQAAQRLDQVLKRLDQSDRDGASLEDLERTVEGTSDIETAPKGRGADELE